MEKRKILDLIKNQPIPLQVWAGSVVEVDGLTCTVKLTESDIEIPEVKLIANTESEQGWVLVPAVGSKVLVGLIENQIVDMYVAQYSEIDALTFTKGDMIIELKSAISLKSGTTQIVVDNDSVLLKQNQVEIVLEGGKVSVKNTGVSLLGLFTDLITLLNSFSVLTSVGPSAGLNPATTLLVTQLQTKVNQLLK